uniref:type IV inositol polyphosphate 5-phosphatase 9-like n=1 Tax=Erigeron canadensis TaxID=72917 RepID=UPI001CB9C953|nr:type IV inositol polyphosphate 5-phosphatase 9-like [Erigeron canadensis]
MWPRSVRSQILNKTFNINNIVADFPSNPECLSDFETVVVAPTMLPENHKTQSYNIFVSTWNVGGVTPMEDLNIDDMLDSQNTSCDIYVLGFQEVVPLKASNILGFEKKNVSTKWNSLISKALNKKSNSGQSNNTDFRCLVSKRMVGLLLSVWVRGDLHPFIRNHDISCVGCGIMGCLGNKGSVSIRFQLHDTSFCFVCCHLASGGGDGDEQHRNSNAVDIFSRTSFSDNKKHLPKRILDHDQVVILGDLNYRISLPDQETRSLVNKNDWNALIKYDQLRTELMDGQFGAWHEGKINFAPTYKYLPNSDEYFSKNFDTKRSPAWCDRILWTGDGLKQSLYTRSESKLSDHRPVKAIFSSQVNVSNLGCRNLYLSDVCSQIPASFELASEDGYSTNCDRLSFQYVNKMIS